MSEAQKKAASLAKSLHDFFRLLRGTKHGELGRDVFAHLFHCAADDYIVLDHLNLAIRAIDKLSMQVGLTTALPDEMKQTAVASLDRLKSLLNVHCLQSSFANVAGQINDAELTTLAILDILIAKEFPVAEIETVDIEEIRQKIESLLADIGNSDLPQDAKLELKQSFVHALSILNLVKYFGADGLWRAFGAAAVEVSRTSATASVEQKGILKRAASILGVAFKAFEKAEKLNRGVKAIEDLSDRIGILG